MESVGRMTRSRARAMGATPIAAIPTNPEPKTTGRRRRGAAKTQDPENEDTVPKQLDFPIEPPAHGQQVPADQPADVDVTKHEVITVEPALDQHLPFALNNIPSSITAGLQQPEDGDMHIESHDNPSVLMASPIITMALKDQAISAGLEPVRPYSYLNTPMALAAEASPTTPTPAEATTALDTLGATQQKVAEGSSPSSAAITMDGPMYSSLHCSAAFSSPSPAIAQTAAAAHALASPLTPPLMGLTVEAIEEAVFSPLPEEDAEDNDANGVGNYDDSNGNNGNNNDGCFVDSPISLAGDADFSLQPTPPLMLTPQHTNNCPHGLRGMEGLGEDEEEGGMEDGDGRGDPADDMMRDVNEMTAMPLAAEQGVDSAGGLSQHDCFQGFIPVPPTLRALEEPNPESHSPSLAGLLYASAPSPSLIAVAATPPPAPPTAPTPPASCFSGPSPVIGVTDATSSGGPVLMASDVPTVDMGLDANIPGLQTSLETAGIPTPSASPLGYAARLPPAPAPTPALDPALSVSWMPAADALVAAAHFGSTRDCYEVGRADGGQPGQTEDMEMEDALPTLQPRQPVESRVAIAAAVASSSTPHQRTPKAAVTAVASRFLTTKTTTTPYQGRSPAAGPVFRNAGTTPTPGKSATAAAGGSATASKATPPASRSSYVYVESRVFNTRTPTAGATAAKPRASIAASTPETGTATKLTASSLTVAAHSNTAREVAAKSAKRVLIHTPEGVRSAAAHRHVVPTPYRPKSAAKQQPVVQPQPSIVQQPAAGAKDEVMMELPKSPKAEQQQQQLDEGEAGQLGLRTSLSSQNTAGADDERPTYKAAAERLKGVQAAEQQQGVQAEVPSGPPPGVAPRPGYLAHTKAFAVKSATNGPMKTKMQAASNGGDSRSLRQLKREVKEAMAKKEAAKVALTQARSAKLTPRVAERQLPMPDDDEGSDDQAEYNEGQENDLVAAMTGLAVASTKTAPVALRGLPAPQGRHIRFNEAGKVSESPQRTVLRGLPVAIGKYKRFE